MPRDGCHECSRRRIKCDKTSPQCNKCIKKGIRCTGIGIRYRFVAANSVVAKPQLRSGDGRKKTGRRTELEGVATTGQTKQLTWPQLPEANPVYALSHSPESTQLTGHALASSAFVPNSTGTPSRMPQIDLGIQSVEPGITMLFDHFSTSVAPIMVVFDGLENGYRTLILPLATEDKLVQQAVCVVSALHFSLKDVRLRVHAETRRSDLIAEMVAKVSAGNARTVFSFSTWATILVLLVGETVTGSDEFSHLFSLVMAHLTNDQGLGEVPPEARDFMVQQTRMFQLFTSPLLGAEAGKTTLAGNLDHYLGFLSGSASSSAPILALHSVTYKDAIMLARDIYLDELGPTCQPAALQARLDRLRRLTRKITRDTPGMHTLVWVYYVAAASSRGLADRQYFTDKLREIHALTGMDNILVALRTLKDIWLNHQTTGWVQNLGSIRPVLAM